MHESYIHLPLQRVGTVVFEIHSIVEACYVSLSPDQVTTLLGEVKKNESRRV